MEGDVDEARNRFLRERVMTATPAQRVVMLFDRLAIDLHRAKDASDARSAGVDLGHATTIVAELYGSLDMAAGGPAENLGRLYGYLLSELTAIRTTGERGRLDAVLQIVTGLRDAFDTAAASLASTASLAATSSTAHLAVGTATPAPARATAWVG
jgi:flagellar protein FliS